MLYNKYIYSNHISARIFIFIFSFSLSLSLEFNYCMLYRFIFCNNISTLDVVIFEVSNIKKNIFLFISRERN